MSLISAIRGFFGIETKTEDLKKETANKTASDVANLPQLIATGKVTTPEGHSGENNTQSNTGGNDNFTSSINREIDIDPKKLAKEYKNDPISALNDKDIGRTYSAQEAEELSQLLKNKTDLRNYFELAKKGNLSNTDIIEGMKEIEANKKSFLFIKWNKLDEEKLAKDMSAIRGIRTTFSAKNIAKTSTIMNLKEKLETKIKHYIANKEIYNDKSALEAINYMDENTEQADEFYANTQRMEGIKGQNYVPKYSGETIVKTGKYVTENNDVADTVWQLADKKDMNNEYFSKTLDNLIQNKEMKTALSEFLNLKDQNGNDRFSAKNISEHSTYMVDKNAKTIERYIENTKELATYQHLSGDNIVTMSANVTDRPEIKTQVMKIAANENISGDEAATYSNTLAQRIETEQQQYTTTIKESEYTHKSKAYENGLEEKDTVQSSTTPVDLSEIQRQKQEALLRATINNESDIQEILSLTETNPELTDTINSLLDKIPSSKVAEIVKKYSDPKKLELYCTNPQLFDANPELLEKYAKNPAYFEKLKFYTSVRDSQLGDFAQYMNSSKKDKVFTYFENHYTSTQVLSMLSSTNHAEQKATDRILENNLISSIDKKSKIEQLKTGTKTSNLISQT